MSIYIPGELPFFVENDEKKKLIYQLPERVKRDTILVHEEINRLTHKPFMGGFDGNGNRWVSCQSARMDI